MSMTIGLGEVFLVGSLAARIPEFLGLVDSIDKKLDRLIKVDLNSAIALVEKATNSANWKDYLTKAAEKFESATHKELGLRKSIAYFGMAFCEFHLGEVDNARISLQNLVSLEVKEDKGPRFKKYTLGGVLVGGAYLTFGVPSMLIGGAAGGISYALMTKDARKKLRKKVGNILDEHLGPAEHVKVKALQLTVQKQLQDGL